MALLCFWLNKTIFWDLLFDYLSQKNKPNNTETSTSFLQVWQALQENRDSQEPVVGVFLDLKVSQESKVRRERLALQETFCQAPQVVQGLLDPLVRQGPVDFQALPQVKTAYQDFLGFLVHKEEEVSLER